MYHRIGTSGAQPYCCCLARVVKTRNRAFLAAQHRCPGSPEPAVYFFFLFFLLNTRVNNPLSRGVGSCNCQAPVAELGAEAVIQNYKLLLNT